MWRAFASIVVRGFDLWKRLERVETKVAELEVGYERLKDQLERLAVELQRDRENAAHQREKLLLQLENVDRHE